MNNHSKRHTVGVVGFRGYSGAELVKILSRHSGVEPVLLEHRSEADARPVPLHATAPRTIEATPDAITKAKLDLVFLGTPPEVSLELAPAILSKGVKVIDLSGAFRLRDSAHYSRWYKAAHTDPQLLASAAYGLPEFYRSAIPNAQLVANPGCYPTAANLALRPLLKAGVVDRTYGVICDAKSGVSGAGRKPSLKTSFCEVTENFSAYGVMDHRHVPEVLQNSGLEEREFTFTAQLLPIERGILETIYLRTSSIGSAEDLLRVYTEAYAHEPFVRLYAPGKLPDLRAVQHTNFCDIGFVFDAASERLVIVAAIDNLVKGAAGQAVQNMNLVLGYPETEALLLKILIKLGGTLLDDEASRMSLATQLAGVAKRHDVVVVHGGGKQVTRFLEERGVQSSFIHGLRVSDAAVIDAVTKVIAGGVNKQLVAALIAAGQRSVGISGIDGPLTLAKPVKAELGFVGQPVSTDGTLLDLLMQAGYVPVVACIAGDASGNIYNVNADQMAVSCATGWRAEKLFFLTDVSGVKGADGALLAHLTPADVSALIDSGVAHTGMQAKLEASVLALQGGLSSVTIALGRESDICSRLTEGEPIGTTITL